MNWFSFESSQWPHNWECLPPASEVYHSKQMGNIYGCLIVVWNKPHHAVEFCRLFVLFGLYSLCSTGQPKRQMDNLICTLSLPNQCTSISVTLVIPPPSNARWPCIVSPSQPNNTRAFPVGQTGYGSSKRWRSWEWGRVAYTCETNDWSVCTWCAANGRRLLIGGCFKAALNKKAEFQIGLATDQIGTELWNPLDLFDSDKMSQVPSSASGKPKDRSPSEPPAVKKSKRGRRSTVPPEQREHVRRVSDSLHAHIQINA